jgi:hypothetical protein
MLVGAALRFATPTWMSAEAFIPFEQYTVLLGPNRCGQTTILEALTALPLVLSARRSIVWQPVGRPVFKSRSDDPDALIGRTAQIRSGRVQIDDELVAGQWATERGLVTRALALVVS